MSSNNNTAAINQTTDSNDHTLNNSSVDNIPDSPFQNNESLDVPMVDVDSDNNLATANTQTGSTATESEKTDEQISDKNCPSIRCMFSNKST